MISLTHCFHASLHSDDDLNLKQINQTESGAMNHKSHQNIKPCYASPMYTMLALGEEHYLYGLVQDCNNSITNPVELLSRLMA